MKKNRNKRLFNILAPIVFIIILLPLSPVLLSREHYSRDEQTNLVALTFDDGYSSWYTSIMPTLARYGLVATGFINDPDYISDFSWDDVHRLSDAGWEIGWHTARHRNVIKMGCTALISDFEICKAKFRDHDLPAPVSFAYPWGAHDSKSMAIVAGYFEAARTIHPGENNPASIRSNPYLLTSYKLKHGLPFIKEVINQNAGQGVLITLTGHVIGQTDMDSLKKPDLSDEEFEQLASFLYDNQAAGKINVVTFKEGVKIVRQRESSVRWTLKLDSPFDSWDKSYGLSFPNRYIDLYDFVFQRELRHYFPSIVPSFTPYLVLSLILGVTGVTCILGITNVIQCYRKRRSRRQMGFHLGRDDGLYARVSRVIQTALNRLKAVKPR